MDSCSDGWFSNDDGPKLSACQSWGTVQPDSRISVEKRQHQVMATQPSWTLIRRQKHVLLIEGTHGLQRL